jgi:hypothetical protein
VISLTYVQSTAVLERVVYRHAQRKISNAAVLRSAALERFERLTIAEEQC